MSGTEPWNPTTREDWVDLFADGSLRAIAKREEEQAKDKSKDGDKDADKDKTPPAPLSFADRLLGNRRQEPAS